LYSIAVIRVATSHTALLHIESSIHDLGFGASSSRA